jgi:hypothetical protein
LRAPASFSTTARQPVSSHSRSNTSAGPIRRAALAVTSPDATASTRIALSAKRAPERSNRSNCPLRCNSSSRPSVAFPLLAHHGAFAPAFDDLEVGAAAGGLLAEIHGAEPWDRLAHCPRKFATAQ